MYRNTTAIMAARSAIVIRSTVEKSSRTPKCFTATRMPAKSRRLARIVK